MTRIYSPDFFFRAERSYVHTTDIYDGLLSGARECGLGQVDGEINLTMRKVMTRNLDIVFCQSGETVEKPKDAAVDFSVGVGGQPVRGWMVESDRAIDRRRDYDENGIHRHTHQDDAAIWIDKPSGASPIEVLTSLAVLLHKTVATPPPGQKWLDTRLNLVRPLTPSDGSAMRVEMVQKLGGKLTKSFITAADRKLGHIYFSLGSP